MGLDKDAADVFDQKTADWLQYAASPGGRLRRKAILHNLRLHADSPPLNVLDVGSGTGEQALELVREGYTVTLLDVSLPMIEHAQSRYRGLDASFVCAASEQIPTLFEPESFDLVMCHSLLEFVRDPHKLLGDLVSVMRKGGLLSVVVGNRCHFALRAAFVDGNLRQAQRALDEEQPALDLFGLPRRTYHPQDARGMFEACGAKLTGEYGVRVFSDLLRETSELTQELVDLELAASARLPYRYMARFIQLIGTKG